MEVLVVADSLLYKSEDGSYWCKTIYGYDFWLRYKNVFQNVAIVSRTKQVSNESVNGFLRVDGPGVRVIELPYLRGMKQYIKHYLSFRKAAKNAIEGFDIAIFRLPSVAATMVLDFYKDKKKPYIIEIVADPYDAYSSNFVAKHYYKKKLKDAALNANGVSYVTKYYLQNKYPSKKKVTGNSEKHFESYYSTIDLRKEYFSEEKKYSETDKPFTIVHTANSINNSIKGHSTVLKVVKKLRDRGYNVRIKFIGDGDKRTDFEEQAERLEIDRYVKFTGLLSSSEDVRDELLNSELFLFPTRAEGLPRAVIEAMAVGLPCLSTPVNGIPELLDQEFLFDPDDVDGFTDKIIQLLNEPDKLENMSKTNINKAKEYTWDKLSHRRNQFYKKLLKLSNKKSN